MFQNTKKTSHQEEDQGRAGQIDSNLQIGKLLEMLETGNGTVTPVVSNLRIYPALVDGYLPFAHFFPPFFIPYALPTR